MDARRHAAADTDPWAREAVRLYRRYQLEIVEACGLCPWALRARLDGKVRERVLAQGDGTDVSTAVAAVHELVADFFHPPYSQQEENLWDEHQITAAL